MVYKFFGHAIYKLLGIKAGYTFNKDTNKQ
ncbi:hypothetical protein FHS70_001334 [Flammeovirga yaeyamensis]|nr:hypothetical protein [Flammeovirga yaeyamensis]